MKEREIKVHTLLDRFHRAATGRMDKELTADDWQELSQLTDDTAPMLRQLAARATPPLRVEEWRLCMLVRMGFKPSEVAVLLGMSSSHVTMLRSRLCEKVFGTKGSAREFDSRVRGI